MFAAAFLVFNEQTFCRNLLSSFAGEPHFNQRGSAIVEQANSLIRVLRQAEDERPSPYSFNIASQDENGTQVVRQESGDEAGRVTGTYTYQDPISGLFRVVSYTADENGFNVRVETNEPGTKTSNPANAEIISSQE